MAPDETAQIDTGAASGNNPEAGAEEQHASTAAEGMNGRSDGEGTTLTGSKPESEDTGKDAEKPGDGEGEEGTEGAPESYDEFKLQDGFTLPPERLARMQEFAKANNWSQEKAQEAVDLYQELRKEELQAMEQNRIDLEAQWHEELTTDPVLARAGKFDENMGQAYAMMKKIDSFIKEDFGDDAGDIMDLMNQSRMGNHPLMIRAIYSLSKRFSEDGIATSKSSGGGAPSREDILYPKS